MSQRTALVGGGGSGGSSGGGGTSGGGSSNKPIQVAPRGTSGPQSPQSPQQQARGGTVPPSKPPPCASRLRPHCNNLWSLWYGVAATGVQALMIATCMRRFAVYASLPWADHNMSPKLELNLYLGLVGVATLVLPFFLVSAIFKVGNLANDGFKLGHHLSSCSREPGGLLPGPGLTGGGVCSSLWRHGGPTAPVLHLAAAFCLLLPRLVIEAKLIQAGFLPKSDIWRTDLDSLLPHRDQLIILDFIAATPFNLSTPLFSGATLPPLPTTPPLPTAPLDNLEVFNLGSLSPEFINYAIALAIYAIRYPAVFWKTNKCFGTLFSLQLFTGAIHSLVTYCGISVLYKIQVCYGSENNPKQGLLLDAKITLALYALSGVLVLCSSLVLYLHGFCKFSSFINRERAKRGEIIAHREVAWGYFPHCAALCVLIAAAVVYAPLLHDCALIYRSTLDTSLLACVIAAIGYLFLWVVTWLLLTVKRHWTFKLRVTIGRAALRSARSIKLVTDVDLRQHGEANAPLLVVGNGRTYTVAESSPKKAIMAVIQRTTLSERRVRVAEEQIYWLRPHRTPTPKNSPDSESGGKWLGKKGAGKHKVTFEDPCTSRKGRGGRGRRGGRGSDSEDDGDYATLRELPLSSSHSLDHSDDTASEENKLLECVRDDTVTYASANNADMLRPLDESPASSVLLLPDPSPAIAAVTADPTQFQGSVTPRCLRRADSGVPMDEPLPRSESVTPESSAGGSPPENSNSSETSSGVHSNSSNASGSVTGPHPHHKRCTSVDDLTLEGTDRVQPQPWRSLSLQRGTQPPTAQTQLINGGNGHYGFMSLPPAPTITTIPENTVVIRRKQGRPKTTDLTQNNEPFERSTNMRMTSFAEPDGSRNPDDPYPTRAQLGLGFCHSFPRTMATFQPGELQVQDGSRTLPSHTENIVRLNESPYTAHQHIQQQQIQTTALCHSFPRHTTIPTHHNGVRLFPPTNGGIPGGVPPMAPLGPVTASGYAKRLITPQNRLHHDQTQTGVHHTFPHIGAVKYSPLPNPTCQLVANQDRDSANYSMASSGDSDSCMPHS